MEELIVLRGGSGQWRYPQRGPILAAGHVPRHVRGEDFARVCARQIGRIADGEAFPPVRLGGGGLCTVTAPDGTVEALEDRAKERELTEARRREGLVMQRWDRELARHFGPRPESCGDGYYEVLVGGRKLTLVPGGGCFYTVKVGDGPLPWRETIGEFDYRSQSLPTEEWT